MKYVKFAMLALLALILSSASIAQVSMGATTGTLQEVVAADNTSTGVTIPLTVGGNVVIKNDFSYTVTVQFRNEAGEVIKWVSILATQTFSGPHTLPAGTFDIIVQEGGTPVEGDDPAADADVT